MVGPHLERGSGRPGAHEGEEGGRQKALADAGATTVARRAGLAASVGAATGTDGAQDTDATELPRLTLLRAARSIN